VLDLLPLQSILKEVSASKAHLEQTLPSQGTKSYSMRAFTTAKTTLATMEPKTPSSLLLVTVWKTKTHSIVVIYLALQSKVLILKAVLCKITRDWLIRIC